MAGDTILVVDDDRAVLRSLERILMADGYTVTCCSTAHGALANIAENPPDAILLDLMMPAMNGREFLAALRNNLGRGDIPVVVITGVRGIDHNQALSMGASDVIEKPFELDELLNKIALVLFRRHRLAPAPATPATSNPGYPTRGNDTVLLLSANGDLTNRIATLVEPRGRRLVALVRALRGLPRVVAVLEPGAVMIDLALPGADTDTGETLTGMRALEALRQLPQLAGLPLLLLADENCATGDIAEKARLLSATSLHRPFDDGDLIAWLDAPPVAERDRA